MMNFITKKRFQRAISKGISNLKDYDLDDILASAGLERRSIAADIMADLGFFALGCLCGGLVGVFFAPARGVEMRSNFKKAINEKGVWTGVTDTVKQQVGSQA